VLVVVVALVVVVVGVAVWGVLTLRGGSPAVAHTVEVPSPTPTASGVAREADTSFASALPSSVLQFALVSSVPDAEWSAAGAIEAYVEEYDSGSQTLTLRAGQWATSTEADDMFGQLTSGAPEPSPSPSSTEGMARFGAVLADGATVGNYVITDNGDGTGLVTWYNTTAVFQLSGPMDEVTRAYSAFPL
jgi:hypothetical protein